MTLKNENFKRRALGNRKQTEKAKPHWLVSYARENLLKTLGTIATVAGLCVIYAYHYHIDYFPSFDVHSMASMIFATTYVGLSVLFLSSLVLLAPSYFVATSLITEAGKATADNGRDTSKNINPDDKTSTAKEPDRKVAIGKESPSNLLGQIAWRFVLAWLAFVSLGSVTVFFVQKGINLNVTYALIFIGFLTYLLAKKVFRVRMRDIWGASKKIIALGYRHRFSLRMLFRLLKRFGQSWWNQSKGALSLGRSMLFVCFLQFSPLMIYFMLIDSAPQFQDEVFGWGEFLRSIVTVGLFLQIASGYLVASWIEPSLARHHRLFSFLLALFLPLLMTFFGGNRPVIVAAVANTTKIGNFRATEITLNDDGCKVIAEEFGFSCDVAIPHKSRICGVHVMSRIGSETYLKLSIHHSRDMNGNTSLELKHPSPELLEMKKSSSGVDGNIVRDVYLPSKDILGVKPDLSKRFVNTAGIEEYLKKTASECPSSPQSKSTLSIALKEVELFSYDKYELTAHGEDVLSKLSQRLGHDVMKIKGIEVIGHSDQIGSMHRNVTLSELRALSVENFLRGRLQTKVRSFVIQSRGVGSTRPIRTATDCPAMMAREKRIDCLADNRRVEIEVTY